MTHVKQPNDFTCGVACVAMITGAPFAELLDELRPTERSGTAHRRIIRALRARGIRCGDRFVSVRGKPLPNSAIVRISHKDKRVGHVVVKQGRVWLNGAPSKLRAPQAGGVVGGGRQ